MLTINQLPWQYAREILRHFRAARNWHHGYLMAKRAKLDPSATRAAATMRDQQMRFARNKLNNANGLVGYVVQP